MGALDKYGLPGDVVHTVINLEGNVNGHDFSMQGVGGGNILAGSQRIKIRTSKGDPIPFAFDILCVAFQYGNRTYTNYSTGFPDYFTQSFPKGFTYERTLRFQDGGTVNVQSDISLVDDKFITTVDYKGEGFPSDGPVMQNDIAGMIHSYETMHPVDETLVGELVLSYKRKSTETPYTCVMKTIYRSKAPVEVMPEYHFVHHRLGKKLFEEENYMDQNESAIGQYSSIPKILPDSP